MDVIGREHELEHVSSFLAALSSDAAVLVVEGEPGIGKTTIWREAIRRAQSAEIEVLTCRPAESEAKLSFSALADLLEPIGDDRLRALPLPQRRALEVAVLREPPAKSPPDARAVATAFRSLLELAAQERPVLVGIDDSQWLDPPSAEAVEFALRRVRGPVGLIATRRPGTGAFEVLARETTPLRLEPLTLAAIHHVVRNTLGSAPSRPILARVHETAGGNPFFALQIARVALASDVPAGAPLPLPEDLSELVLQRIEGLTPQTREVLLTVAAAASPTRALLTEIHGEVDLAIEEAEEASIAEVDDRGVRFAHPLYGAAVYASVGTEHRRRVHSGLGQAVVEPEERARHLALAATPPDEETAERVHAAAREVAARGAFGAAAGLVEQAIRLGGATDERLVDLGEFLHQSGNSARAAEVLLQVQDWTALAEEQQITGLWTLVDSVYWTKGGLDAVALGEKVLTQVEAPQAKAALHGKISTVLEFDMARGLEHAEAALSLLDALGDTARPDVLGLALGIRERNRLALGLGLDKAAVERAIELETGGYIARSYGQWLKYVDDFDGSRLWLQRSMRGYEETGEDVSIPNVLQQLAMTECWAGNLALAAEYAARSCELAEEMEITPVGPYRVRSIVEAHRGNESEVRAIAERLYSEGWAPEIIQHVEIGLGLLEHSLGNDEAADRHLRTALELGERMGQLEPGVHRAHGDAAEVALSLGDPGRATEIAEHLEEHGRRTGHAWSTAVALRTKGLIHAAEGDLEAGLAAMDAALTAHEGLPMPYELARTLLVKGQIERRARHRREARESLERARTIFEDIGARLWAARASEELKRIPIRHRAPGELTESEERVAELAASGMTNKEVAQALFISPKTVEATLSRAYGKLDIRSRAELGARMASRRLTRAG